MRQVPYTHSMYDARKPGDHYALMAGDMFVAFMAAGAEEDANAVIKAARWFPAVGMQEIEVVELVAAQ